MSQSDELGPYAPLIVSGMVIVILLFMTPLDGRLVGIPINLAAVALVAVGGILGTIGNT
jgi:hypothetical protein